MLRHNESLCWGETMSLEDRAITDRATFRDHCVVDPGWLALASAPDAPALPFVWHSKIRAVLDLIAANAANLDRYAGMQGTGAGDGQDQALSASAYKASFFGHHDVLERVLLKAASSYSLLVARLGNAPVDLRSRALHTYAAAAALRLVGILQRFEGALYTSDDRPVLRLFPDLPNFRGQFGPMIGLPYRHPVNGLAYGAEAESGFLVARICGESESAYQNLSLTRFDAEGWQERRPGPAHLFYGWVLPQWLLFRDEPVPDEAVWWITELRDEIGQRRFARSNESPWSGPGARTLPLPHQYGDWPVSLFEPQELAPSLTAWVLRRPVSEGPPVAAEVTLDLPPSTHALVRETRVLCVAAAQVEFTAALERLENEFGAGRPVSIGEGSDHAVEFVDRENAVRWFIVVLSFQGQVESTAKVARLVPLLRPDITLMVGMCMGMPKRRLPVGTVIVPNEVWSFDHQRLTEGGTEIRPHGSQEDNPLYEVARIVGARKFSYRLVVDKGLASASAKVENMKSDLIRRVENAFPDAAAYDMEGWGFYKGAGGASCLWIKGVADSGEAQGVQEDDRSRKQSVQGDATANALDFALLLVREAVKIQPAVM